MKNTRVRLGAILLVCIAVLGFAACQDDTSPYIQAKQFATTGTTTALGGTGVCSLSSTGGPCFVNETGPVSDDNHPNSYTEAEIVAGNDPNITVHWTGKLDIYQNSATLTSASGVTTTLTTNAFAYGGRYYVTHFWLDGCVSFHHSAGAIADFLVRNNWAGLSSDGGETMCHDGGDGGASKSQISTGSTNSFHLAGGGQALIYAGIIDGGNISPDDAYHAGSAAIGAADYEAYQVQVTGFSKGYVALNNVNLHDSTVLALLADNSYAGCDWNPSTQSGPNPATCSHVATDQDYFVHQEDVFADGANNVRIVHNWFGQGSPVSNTTTATGTWGWTGAINGAYTWNSTGITSNLDIINNYLRGWSGNNITNSCYQNQGNNIFANVLSSDAKNGYYGSTPAGGVDGLAAVTSRTVSTDNLWGQSADVNYQEPSGGGTVFSLATPPNSGSC